MKIKCLIIIIGIILSISNVIKAKSNTDTAKLTSSQLPQIPYIFVTKWGGEGKEDGQFTNPSSIAVDSQGNIYVTDTGNSRIQKFDSQGNFIAKWGEEDEYFTNPVNIKLDGKDNVYVVNIKPDYIQKFDSTGEFITSWKADAIIRDFAIDCNDMIYIIHSFNLILKSKLEVAKPQLISLERPGFLESIVVDSTGHIYMACDTLGTAPAIWFQDEKYAQSYLCIQKFDTSFNVIKEWWSADKEKPFAGYFTEDGIAAIVELGIDSKDNIYVSDRRNNQIQKFDSNGNFISKFGTKGSGDGEFNRPGAIAIDKEGNLYVLDTGNCRIQKFKPNPEFKLQ